MPDLSLEAKRTNMHGFPRSGTGKRKLVVGVLSVLLAIVFCFGTGLINRWGEWYSGHLVFRWQTEAMLKGHIAMASDPSGMAWDLAWGMGSVQQVWGLAVPLWRLPFEAVARMCGQPGFPDRLAFAVAIACYFYLLWRTGPFEFAPGDGNGAGVLGLIGIWTLALFPPFWALCSTRFLVYEEVAAYGFMVGSLLVVWAARMWVTPSTAGFLALAFVAGFSSFVRPTVGACGVASFVIAGVAFLGGGGRVQVVFLAIGLYAIGIVSLLCANATRFGSPFEFGYSLNANGMSVMAYGQRFGNPYSGESLLSAARELFSLLFTTGTSGGANAYGTGLFSGQSSTFRWRELYFSTYDLSYFAMVVTAWGWGLWRGWRLLRNGSWLRDDARNLRALEGLAFCSLLTALPMVVFYLRFPFISSRYLVDFAPPFAAAVVVFFGVGLGVLGGGRRVAYCVLAVFVAGWLFEIGTIKLRPSSNSTAAKTWRSVAASMKSDLARPRLGNIPTSYTFSSAFEKTGISFNGAGWDHDTGDTEACVTLFVKSPEFLAIDVVSAERNPLPREEYDCIRAKIGLEFLERESVVPTTNGMRIIFRLPKRKTYQTGMQMASLGMVYPKDLSEGYSKFRLLKVSWHRAEEEGKDLTAKNAKSAGRGE